MRADIGNWIVAEAAARGAERRRGRTAETLAANGGGVLLLRSSPAGEPKGAFRFSDPAFRRLAGLDEPDCWLWVDADGSSRIYAKEADPIRELREGFELGADRVWEATGVEGRPMDQLEGDIKALFEEGKALWLMDGPSGSKALPGGWGLAARGVVREAWPLMEASLAELSAEEAALARDAWNAAACSALAAAEAIWRGTARERELAGLATGSALNSSMGGFSLGWESPGEGPLAKALARGKLSHDLCGDTAMGAFSALSRALGCREEPGSRVISGEELCAASGQVRGTGAMHEGLWFGVDARLRRGSFCGRAGASFPVSGKLDGARGAIWKLARSAARTGAETLAEGVEPEKAELKALERLAEGLAGLGLCPEDPASSLAAAKRALWGGPAVFPEPSTMAFRTPSKEFLAEPVKAGQVWVSRIGLRFPRGAGWPEWIAGFGLIEEAGALVAPGGQPPELLGSAFQRDTRAMGELADACGLGARDGG